MGNGIRLNYEFTRPHLDKTIIEEAPKPTLEKALETISAQLVDDVTPEKGYRFEVTRHNRYALAAQINRMTIL